MRGAINKIVEKKVQGSFKKTKETFVQSFILMETY